MTTTEIEEEAVFSVKRMLNSINRSCNESIVHDILLGDKTPTTDGFIRIENKEIAIQVKGTKSKTAKKNIQRKYLEYAKENLLLYILVDSIEKPEESNIYYEFINRDKLEKLFRGKPNQDSYTNVFKNKLTCDLNCTFVDEFIQEFNKRDEKKSIKLSDISDNGELNFNLRIENNGTFNEGHEIKLQTFTNSDTGLLYKIREEPNSITKLFAIEEGYEEFEFEGIKLKFKKKFDHVTKELQLSSKHFTYTLLQNQNIYIEYTQPEFANNICIESFKFNKRLLDEAHVMEYASTLNAIESYEKYIEIKKIIGDKVKVPFSAVDELHEFLHSKTPVNDFEKVKYFIEDTTLDFYWHDNKYNLTSQDRCKIITPDKREMNLEIPYYFIFLFQGIINPSSILRKLSFTQYDLLDKDIITYINTFITSGLDNEILKYNIKSICYNLILYFNNMLITEALSSRIIQIGEQLLDNDIQILGLTMKKINKQLNLKEKQYIYSVMDEIENRIILYLAYSLVDACQEYDSNILIASEHQKKLLSQLKEVINAED